MKELEVARRQALSMLNNKWAEWEHISSGLTHCNVCLALDKCWFQNINGIKMPILPQHENCHCKAKIISAPIPGETAQAECLIEKFTHYIFSDNMLGMVKKLCLNLLDIV